MTSNDVRVRVSNDGDRDRILAIHRDAFGDDEGPVIANLVEEMLDDPSGDPIFSLVAQLGDELVGHVLFTSVTVEPNSEVSAQILAPLAVASERHGQGIGSQLVHDGFAHLQQSGVELVFVLGYPDYYSRFGFAPAGVRGFQAPYPILPKNADAWMVHELASGSSERYEGIIRCSKALDHPQYWQE
ncbi:MAG: N-acetyltransferase [Planctomycetota bacterium]